MYPILELGTSNDFKYSLLINSSKLERKNVIQKKVKISELMEDCVFFPDNEVKDWYVPLSFAVTVRDKSSNRVLVKEDDGICRTFIYIKEVRPIEFTGYDLVMFMSSVGIVNILKTTSNGNEPSFEFKACMSRSVFDVSGLMWLEKNEEKDCLIFNPMIMTTVFVDADEFKEFVIDEWKFIPIEEAKEKGGQIKCILDDLVLVDYGKE